MDHAGKPQPPPLVAKRPEREHRVRVAGTQQAHGNPGHVPGAGAGHPEAHQLGYVTGVVRTRAGINWAELDPRVTLA